MPFAFNANNFRTQFITGPAKSGRFNATIYGLPDIAGGPSIPGFGSGGPGAAISIAALAILPFRIKSISLPGKQVQTLDRQYTGPLIRTPAGMIHDKIQLTVIEDEAYLMSQLFHNWMEYIYDDVGRDETHTVKYHDDVKADKLLIAMYSDALPIPTFIYEAKDVFPTAISPIEQSWDDENQILTFNVDMTYRDYTTYGGAEAIAKAASGFAA